MKETEGEKKIVVTSSLQEGNVLVKVSDSGSGIPDGIKDKIFDPFYTTKNGSTGIGLSLCRRIITDHGGTLNLLKSRLGGAQFTIQIPVDKGKE